MSNVTSFDRAPVFLSSGYLVITLALNIMTVLFFVDGLFDTHLIGFALDKCWRFMLGGVLLVAFIVFYYSYKGRYLRIVEHYETRTGWKKTIRPVWVILFYIVVSFGLLLLAGSFYHKYWIFAR
jgi:hypothetical protein